MFDNAAAFPGGNDLSSHRFQRNVCIPLTKICLYFPMFMITDNIILIKLFANISKLYISKGLIYLNEFNLRLHTPLAIRVNLQFLL